MATRCKQIPIGSHRRQPTRGHTTKTTTATTSTDWHAQAWRRQTSEAAQYKNKDTNIVTCLLPPATTHDVFPVALTIM
eukprot:3038398-Lingulodinium_polyedra.AAC.1